MYVGYDDIPSSAARICFRRFDNYANYARSFAQKRFPRNGISRVSLSLTTGYVVPIVLTSASF